jgi:homoserine dehydrogenase
MIQKIFIIWATWNVWRELVNQIITNDTVWKHVNPSQIIWMANSKKYVFNSRWFKPEKIIDITKWKKEANEYIDKNWKNIKKITDLVDLIKVEWLNWEVVFVDVTSWKDELLEFHKYVITNSQNYLVTANKNPISLYSMKDFDLLNKYSWRYDTNTTVMWWAWVLLFVNNRINRINDNILEISWMFSWTLGFILSELEKLEKPFSQIVREAKQLWYTEPNPWDDLNWLDVARKLIILARYSWHKVDINDIEITPLINSKYSKFEWEEFLKAIEREDELFNQKVEAAREIWEVLRYVWEMKYKNNKVTFKVWLKSVPKNSDLWTLAWTSNISIIETDILRNPYPHVIKSRWAWLAVTAWSVRIWIAKMLPHNIISR